MNGARQPASTKVGPPGPRRDIAEAANSTYGVLPVAPVRRSSR